jgi:hypothetical protein
LTRRARSRSIDPGDAERAFREAVEAALGDHIQGPAVRVVREGMHLECTWLVDGKLLRAAGELAGNRPISVEASPLGLEREADLAARR